MGWWRGSFRYCTKLTGKQTEQALFMLTLIKRTYQYFLYLFQRSKNFYFSPQKTVMISSVSCSGVPDSLQPHGPQPTRLLCPWDFPGKNTGMGCHSFSRGSSWPRDGIWISCTAGRFFTDWATREAKKTIKLYNILEIFSHLYHLNCSWKC